MRAAIGNFIERFGRIVNGPSMRLQREAMAATMLGDSLRATNFEGPIFPGGYAASAALLYEFLRCCELLRPAAVLECGAGQSTLLSNHYARRNPEAQVVTLEDDAAWTESVRQRIGRGGEVGNHRLMLAPLAEVGRALDVTYSWYSGAEVERVLAKTRFSLVLVDGPSGRNRGARIGISNHMPRILDTDFVVIFDDAENRYVRESIARCCRGLAAEGIDYRQKILEGEKTQVLVTSVGFASVVGGRRLVEPWAAPSA